MKWIFLLVSLPFLLLGAWEELPVSYQGRILPVIAYEQLDHPPSPFNANPVSQGAPFKEQLWLVGDHYRMLPSSDHSGTWYPLGALNLSVGNFTLYPDPLFEEMRQAYRNRDLTALSQKLFEGYGSLANTPLQEGLAYPSIATLKLEALYYRVPLTQMIICAYALAALLFAMSTCRSATVVMGLAIVLHTALLLMRVAILGRPPVSNMYETLLFVPWVASAMGFALYYWIRDGLVPFASSFVAFALLSLLYWTFKNHDLSVVQPVLNSQFWLTIHVLMVVGSYGLFALASVIGHIQLITSTHKSALGSSLVTALYIGLTMLIIGTVLGGVWAAQSWGRFWDWDPKESWAFISILVYLLFIHSYRFGKIGNWGLSFGAVTGFLFITFTWYGVNYILGTGLHSYGFGNGGETAYFIFIAGESLFLFLILLQKKWGNRIHGFIHNKDRHEAD